MSTGANIHPSFGAPVYRRPRYQARIGREPGGHVATETNQYAGLTERD